MVAEQPERLADIFRNRFDLLSPVNQRSLVACYPHRDDLIERIHLVQSKPGQPLAGVPYMLQDLFDVCDLPTRCGAPFQAPFDHELEVSCRLQQALVEMGAILIAKLVPSEFGIDARGRNPSFGDCPHANSSDWVCGGGAGSCAHAVKKAWVPLAFGLDGAGGVRIPAAFHGLFGFRMNDRALTHAGVVPSLPSLESVGCMTHTLDDLSRTFAVFYPHSQINAAGIAPRGFLLREPGIPISADVKAGLMDIAHCLELETQSELNSALCRGFEHAQDTLERIQNRELYSIHKYWFEEYKDDYDAKLGSRLEAGRNCTGKQADRAAVIQQSIRACFTEFFESFDFLVSPISPQPTPNKTDWSEHLERDLLHLNAPASLGLLPSLILPFPCRDGRYSAAQVILHPNKLELVPQILEKMRRFYA